MTSAALPVRFYHGSTVALEAGTVLSPRGAAYETDWRNTDFYMILERWRPSGALAHRDSVFLVGVVDDVDLAGGGTEFCFEVEPIGPVSRHDLNWSSEISCLVGDGFSVDSPQVRAAAEAYWAGTPHFNESVWEYLCKSAKIIRCEPYESFDMDARAP